MVLGNFILISHSYSKRFIYLLLVYYLNFALIENQVVDYNKKLNISL